LFIGVDANRRPLEKISEKIYRRPAKGGLSNVLFVQAAVENLPEELQGIATEVHVQFPWGSLLRGVAGGDEVVMHNLRSICLPDALLHVTLGLDLERDRFEWERLELPLISIDYIERVLNVRYLHVGFRVITTEAISALELAQHRSSWAKRLQRGAHRSFFRITALAE
jgi:16S rRNA (adenine(1408)-N(1))-methyltransferase